MSGSGGDGDDWGGGAHHAEEEGEPWLVSYADMMTLLFGFFVLMYSFAVAKLDDSSDDWIRVKKEVSRFFGDPSSANVNTKDIITSKSEPGTSGGVGDNASTPVVPFDSKFRFLATRNEVIQDINRLLGVIEDREKKTDIESMKRQAEVDVLKRVIEKIRAKTKQGNDDERSAIEQEVEEISVAFDARVLVAASGSSAEALIFTAQGEETIRKLGAQLAAFSQPLRVAVEARVSPRTNLKPTEKERSDAYTSTSRRALFVSDRLRTHLNASATDSKPLEHVFAVGGLGYWRGSALPTDSLQDAIVVRVAFLAAAQAK